MPVDAQVLLWLPVVMGSPSLQVTRYSYRYPSIPMVPSCIGVVRAFSRDYFVPQTYEANGVPKSIAKVLPALKASNRYSYRSPRIPMDPQLFL